MAENISEKLGQILEAPERGLEAVVERRSAPPYPERPLAMPPGSVNIPGPATSVVPPATAPARLQDIEQVLEEDLDEVFMNLSAKQQARFKAEGEETAREINTALSGVKVQIQKIINLIRQWLMLIPGVSKFFIEQEAKIKSDKIIGKYGPKQ